MTLLFVSWALLITGSVPGLLGSRFSVWANRFSCGAQALGSLLLAALGGLALSGKTATFLLPSIAYLGQLEIGTDHLSGVFLLVLGVIGFATNIFAVGYLKHSFGRWNFNWLPLFNGLFIASIAGVFVSRNVLVFLFFWETMALTSFALVVVESLHERERRTGFVYLAMTHIAAGFLFGALLFPCTVAGGGFGLESWLQGMSMISSYARNLMFAALLIGFGTKAGVIPLHVWLPRAHPQAPAHVSALMSGVMIKAGVFGILRFMAIPFFPVPIAWGWVIISIGVMSAFLGILYALNQHHLKSMLAYCSVENVGLIFMALGMGFLFRSYGREAEATLAFTAALFHTMNHALSKSLLFLAAGAVQSQTHTGNMDDLGGLAKNMPKVSMLFFIGAVSIAALPPLNGFASEWLIYRAIISGFALPSLACKVAMPLYAALMGLTGALAAGCFVSAFGTVFLGKAHSRHVRNAVDSEPIMIAGMGILAVLCVVLGVMPELVTVPFSTFDGRPGMTYSETAPLAWMNKPTEALAPLLILSALVLGLLLGRQLLRWRQTEVREESVGTWNCGTPLTERMSYTTTAFSEPFIVNFAFLFAPHRQFKTETTVSPHIPVKMKYRLFTHKIFEEFLYLPTLHLFLRTSHTLQKLQAGSLHVYLLLMFVVLVLLLLIGVWA
jgi:hydrogenase-4 component B